MCNNHQVPENVNGILGSNKHEKVIKLQYNLKEIETKKWWKLKSSSNAKKVIARIKEMVLRILLMMGCIQWLHSILQDLNLHLRTPPTKKDMSYYQNCLQCLGDISYQLERCFFCKIFYIINKNTFNNTQITIVSPSYNVMCSWKKPQNNYDWKKARNKVKVANLKESHNSIYHFVLKGSWLGTI